MSEKTGKLVPSDDAKSRAILTAAKSLETNACFTTIRKRIEERLNEINEHNLTRGTENPYTEGQAWKWFLNMCREASSSGEKFSM